jgi:hypothetical protein
MKRARKPPNKRPIPRAFRRPRPEVGKFHHLSERAVWSVRGSCRKLLQERARERANRSECNMMRRVIDAAFVETEEKDGNKMKEERKHI